MVMTFLAAAMAEDMRRNNRDKAALQQELATDMEGERVEATEPRKIAYPTPKPVSAPRRRSTVAEVVVPTMAKATSLVDAVMDGVEAVVEGEPAFDATTHRRRLP